MTQTGPRARLSQETKPCRFVPKAFLIDDLQCHETMQVHVERLVGYAHCAAAQFHGPPIAVRNQFIVRQAGGCIA
jgi:hypothetical protein